MNCVICSEEAEKITLVLIPKGLSRQMFGIEDGYIPVCDNCKDELPKLIQYSLKG